MGRFILKSVFNSKWLLFKKEPQATNLLLWETLVCLFLEVQVWFVHLWLVRLSPTCSCVVCVIKLCIMIQILVSVQYWIIRASEQLMCVSVWPYEALQYSCIKIILILSCLMYLLVDKTTHPAFYLAVIFVKVGRWWLGFRCFALGFLWYSDFFSFLVCEIILWWWYLPKAFLIAAGIQCLLLSLACGCVIKAVLSRQSYKFCLLLRYNIDLFTEHVSKQNGEAELFSAQMGDFAALLLHLLMKVWRHLPVRKARLIPRSFLPSRDCCLCSPNTFIFNADCSMSREKYIARRRGLKIGLSTF